MRELNKFPLYILKVLLNLHNVPLQNINCTEPYLGALNRSYIIVQISNCKIRERVLLNGAICKRFSKVSRRWRCAAYHLLQVFNSINSGGEDVILAFIDDEEEVEASNDTLWKIPKPKIENWLFFLLILYIFYVWKIVKKCLSKWTEFIFELTEVAATSVEWIVNNFTLNRKYKPYCTLQNICMSGLIMIMSLLKGGGGVTPKKWLSVGGGGIKKNEDWVGGHGNS